MLNKSSLFLKIQAYLKSPREISYEKSCNKISIQYFWVPLNDLKKNWPSVLFLLVGFGILPVVVGLSQVIFGLLEGDQKSFFVHENMFFLLIFLLFCLGAPIFIYKKLIKPIFAIRTVILDSNQIVIQDRFFGSRPKIKLALPRYKIQKILWQDTSFIEKLNKQVNNKLYFIHEGGKTEIISTYLERDLLKIQELLERYLSGERIEKIETNLETTPKKEVQVSPIIEKEEKKIYPIYKLIFFHIIGKRGLALAPLTRYLGVNAWIGALGLFSVILSLARRTQIEQATGGIDIGYLLLQGLLSVILLIGWPLNRLYKVSDSTNRQLLSVGGLIIFSYACYQLYSILPGIKEALESATRIRYSPGLITFLTSYGFWLICQFGFLRTIYKTSSFGKWMPRLVFLFAAFFDVYLSYLFIKTSLARMADLRNMGHEIK